MKLASRSLLVLAVAAAIACGNAFAAEAAKPAAKELTPQQQRMADCNKQAEGKKGDERKTFMSSCLKGETAVAHKETQQEKMKHCNADANTKQLKGDERKSYMSTCLKGDATAAAPAH